MFVLGKKLLTMDHIDSKSIDSFFQGLSDYMALGIVQVFPHE